jgi:hypothetical protein
MGVLVWTYLHSLSVLASSPGQVGELVSGKTKEGLMLSLSLFSFCCC